MPLAQKYIPVMLPGESRMEQFLLATPWHAAMKSFQVLSSVVIFVLSYIQPVEPQSLQTL